MILITKVHHVGNKKGHNMYHHTGRNLIIYLCTLILISLCSNAYAKTNQQALLFDIEGSIGPATQDYIHRGFKLAKKKNANFVIIRINTPGGLVSSTQEIIKDILNSPCPVITYVSPKGARAASAGTYVMYASNIAAMSPGTNLGAATPVQVGNLSPQPNNPNQKNPNQQKLRSKVLNDAAAYLRSLAELHNRNADWAETSVRTSASLTAKQALKLNVINLIANNSQELLSKLNGRKINQHNKTVTLETKDVNLIHVKPNWRTTFLSIITNPTIAYILLLIGIYGMFFEFSNPGMFIPGVIGAISLLVALYAFQLLPISYAGLGLLFLGLALMVVEAFIPSFGILGIGGIIAFVFGSILLLDMDVIGHSMPWLLIIFTGCISALFFYVVIGMAVKSKFRKKVSGKAGIIGKTLMLEKDFNKKGWIRINSEHWKAESAITLNKGQKVKVTRIKGLSLFIEIENGE